MANPAITEHIFNAPFPLKSDYNLTIPAEVESFALANTKFQTASNRTGSYMGIYGLSSMLFALILTLYTAKRKINRKYVHLTALILGGVGFLLMYGIKDPVYLTASFTLIGFAWGSILSMPYAMLSGVVDKKNMGVAMGLFNIFIVLPQIIAATGGINFLSSLLGSASINAMIIAGLSLILAGVLNLFINEQNSGG